jgi:hypothetical protein
MMSNKIDYKNLKVKTFWAGDEQVTLRQLEGAIWQEEGGQRRVAIVSHFGKNKHHFGRWVGQPYPPCLVDGRPYKNWQVK